LLPLLIGVVEFCLPTHLPRLPRWFITVFVVFPSLAVLAYLLSQWNPAPHPWPQRSFNQIERLLTEARILWDYLGWWYWPRIEDAGLFRDAIEVSRSLWQPLTTLPAVLAFLPCRLSRSRAAQSALVQPGHPVLPRGTFAGIDLDWLGVVFRTSQLPAFGVFIAAPGSFGRSYPRDPPAALTAFRAGGFWGDARFHDASARAALG